MNWNILVTSGKEIKRDSMISVNESRTAYIKISIYLIIIKKNEIKKLKKKYNNINKTLA